MGTITADVHDALDIIARGWHTLRNYADLIEPAAAAAAEADPALAAIIGLYRDLEPEARAALGMIAADLHRGRAAPETPDPGPLPGDPPPAPESPPGPLPGA